MSVDAINTQTCADVNPRLSVIRTLYDDMLLSLFEILNTTYASCLLRFGIELHQLTLQKK
ncbi:hypothetical protein T08_9777 [Trichinella sp. T8]|nr:hypothetical protein T08_9777 [Trichinella sp. T8]